MRKPPSVPSAWAGATLAAFLLLTACSGAAGVASSADDHAPATVTATAFQPAPPSPTPAVRRLWLSPSVPAKLAAGMRQASVGLDPTVELVPAEAQADLRLVPGGTAPVAEWIYAVAAPFPTVRDSIGLEELRSLWRSQDPAQPPIYATNATILVMKDLLGDPGTNVRRSEDPAAMVEAAWQARPSLAILPFEDLEPRWKVLELDGQSPIHKDFDSSAYPLRVTFGLEGGDVPTNLGRALELAQGMALPLANRRSDRLTTVAMTGVTALTRATAWEMNHTGVTRPARDIGDWLRTADITHISHEVAFTPDCPPPTANLTALVFCAQPAHIGLLEDVGTDVIELTGNHVLDAGEQALLYTLDLYRSKGWRWFGGGENLEDARKPVLIEHNGNKIAFIGCNEAGPPGAWATADRPGANPCAPDRLVDQVRGLRQDGYLPIFTFQWNEYYQPNPSGSQEEAFLAEAAAGAVAVSGSQAHQPQGFAFADGAFIHYGLGNLFFDQMWSEQVRQEFVDRYVFHDGRLISVELLTAYLEDWSRPRPMTPDERAAFLQGMFQASGW